MINIGNHLFNFVHAPTIMQTLRDQEGFRTRKDRILSPPLYNTAKLRCMKWGESFWMF